MLWLTVLLTVIASSFAYSMRGEALAARNAMSLAQARATADGAVERMAFELSRPRNLQDVWRADGQPHAWKEGDVEVIAAAVDESAQIDLNTAPDPLLKGLLQNVGGLDPDDAQQVLEAILDWRDADELRRPNGAEAADYRAAGSKQVPTNAPFESVGELRRVARRHRAAHGQAGPTVSRSIRGSAASTRRPPLATCCWRFPSHARAGRRVHRRTAPKRWRTGCRFPRSPPRRGLPPAPLPYGGSVPMARLPDGVTFARDAVLRPSTIRGVPFVTLLWQEGPPGA